MPPASSCFSPSPSSSSSPSATLPLPCPDRGKKPRREAPTGGGHARHHPCLRAKGEEVGLCVPRRCASSRDAPRSSSSFLSAAAGLDWIGFYLPCSPFENLRCSHPNLRPQEKEESKFLKLMWNPLSTYYHRGL